MNRHIRHSVMIHGRGDVRIAPMETGIGPEMDMGTKEILSQIDAAAARGSDVFFLDASWYCPPDKTENDWLYYVGDWFPKTERYDMSMAEIRDYCKKKGLKFGLWMEPERLGRDSQILKEHPEYCTYGYDDQIKGGVRRGRRHARPEQGRGRGLARSAADKVCGPLRAGYAAHRLQCGQLVLARLCPARRVHGEQRVPVL